jgi:hypothetical protein
VANLARVDAAVGGKAMEAQYSESAHLADIGQVGKEGLYGFKSDVV